MTDTEREAARYTELAELSYTHARATFTDFLGLAESDVFFRAARDFSYVPYTLWGGAEGCERVIVRFGDEDTLGYPPPPFPIVCLSVRPKAKKFADELTHRDILGALMNLGVRREMLGDIFPGEDASYVFVSEKIAPFLAENLIRIKHTDVLTSVTDCPEELATPVYRAEEIQVSSLRLDTVVAHAYRLSRAEAQEAMTGGRVFLDGRSVTDFAISPHTGAVITLRGAGRVRFGGAVGETKKGKIRVKIERPER